MGSQLPLPETAADERTIAMPDCECEPSCRGQHWPSYHYRFGGCLACPCPAFPPLIVEIDTKGGRYWLGPDRGCLRGECDACQAGHDEAERRAGRAEGYAVPSPWYVFRPPERRWQDLGLVEWRYAFARMTHGRHEGYRWLSPVWRELLGMHHWGRVMEASSSTVERPAVNGGVAGSNPASGLPGMTHTWAWGRTQFGPLHPDLAGRKGERCRVVVRGWFWRGKRQFPGNILVEFADGYRVVASRRAVRRGR